jgi:hypothetical protein
LIANRFCASWTAAATLCWTYPIAHPHQTHFDINIAVDALWNLRENLRYLLALHREGQRQFARQQKEQKAKAQKLKEKDDAATLVKMSNFRA